MEWYSKYLQVYEKPFAEAPQAVIEEVRRNLAGLQSNEPLVTVSLIGYNEEKHLLACLWSLSEMKCKYPVEIIGVDNESKDRTAEIYEACGVPYFTETQHSCGFARLCGLNHARENIISTLILTRCIRQSMWKQWWMRSKSRV